MLEIILRLRQAVIHPNIALESLRKKFRENAWKYNYSLKGNSSKINSLLSVIKKVSGLSLVFCHFKDEMDMIQDNLSKNGIISHRFDGGMNSSQKDAVISMYKKENAIRRFKKVNGCIQNIPFDKPTVLIIQIKAGGVGLNLQQFTNVFIVSPDWNPTRFKQSQEHTVWDK